MMVISPCSMRIRTKSRGWLLVFYGDYYNLVLESYQPTEPWRPARPDPSLG